MKKGLQHGSTWYRLFCVRGLGPKRLHIIHDALTASKILVEDLFEMDRADLESLLPELGDTLLERIQQSDAEQNEKEYQDLIENEVRLVHLGHEDYPERIHRKMCDSAPAVLFCRGNLGLLQSDGVAIVGARDASPQGLSLAGRFAADLALQGKNVVSGYAKGVDREAHQGALNQGGTTTVVLSSGILEFALKRDMEEVNLRRDVLVVSQFAPRDRWRASNAMIRNRLVCALSEAVIVIEAGEERDREGKMSGTFDAGKTALAMGVPLLVLNPEVLDDPPPGNRRLIEMGGMGLGPESVAESVLEAIQNSVAKPSSAGRETEQSSLF